MQLGSFGNSRVNTLAALCVVAIACLWVVSPAGAMVVLDEAVLMPEKDATLYSYINGPYDDTDPDTFPMADGVTHLHVGDTNNTKGVQRGLMQFDLSGIPSDAVVTGVSLTVKVADVPNRVLPGDLKFWMVAMDGLSTPWQQGPGPGTGTGEQQAALPSDTTWFHTEYDPSLHGELGNTDTNPYHGNLAVEPGHWAQPGYFGDAELLDTEPGTGVGGLFDDTHALIVPADVGGKVLADTVAMWSNDRMLDDVRAWIDGTKENFGWIMVGEEWIDDDQQSGGKNQSSKLDFYSGETGEEYSCQPTLRVTYSVVPEPGTLVLMLLGLATLLVRRVR